MGINDWIEIILLGIFNLITISIAFIAIPILEKKKKDVPVWLISVGYVSVFISFIIDGIMLFSMLH